MGPAPGVNWPGLTSQERAISLLAAEGLTIRQLYERMTIARGHLVLVGSYRRVARTMAQWLRSGAADGFNVMPPYFHEGFEDFVELVVPILQERGLYRTDYEGTTLRDHLGLKRPTNPYFS